MNTEQLLYQVNSAVGACHGRIENGMAVHLAFAQLAKELEFIFTQGEFYEQQ